MLFKFSNSKKEEYDKSRLPPNWPSYLHGKCDSELCKYPNPPQAAEGRYSCRGASRGFHCEGIYFVTKSMANTVMRNHRKQMKKDDEAREKAAYEAEIARLSDIKAELEEEARRRAAVDLARHRAMEKQRHNGGDYVETTGLARSGAQRKARSKDLRSQESSNNGHQPPTHAQVALYPTCVQHHIQDKQYHSSSSAFVNPRAAPRPPYSSTPIQDHAQPPYPMPHTRNHYEHPTPLYHKPSRRKF